MIRLDTFFYALRLTLFKCHGAGKSSIRHAIVLALMCRAIAARQCGTILCPGWWLVRIGRARSIVE